MNSSIQIATKAREYIKSNKTQLCQKFADPKNYPPVENPSAYFMAGSPGAGKTEFSKSFIKELTEKEPKRRIVRIDADEIRDFIPFYDKTNAYRVQGAAALGVEKLLDYVLKHKQDFILDATFADYQKARTNILRCTNKNRKVGIVYLYQDPIIAWKFTQKREALEGRKIPMDIFVKAFFEAYENVKKVKKEFGNQIELWLIVKNLEQGIEKTYFNIDNIDSYMKISYTAQSLEKELRDNYV